MKKLMKVFILLVMVLGLMGATAGSIDDPLVAKSWVDQYVDGVFAELNEQVDASFDSLGVIPSDEEVVVVLYIGDNVAYVDGVETIGNTAPVLVDDWTLIPFRLLGECLGAVVSYDNDTKTAGYEIGGTLVEVIAWQSVININGTSLATSSAAQIIDSNMMVPLRVISESFGYTVNWYNDEKKIEIIIN